MLNGSERVAHDELHYLKGVLGTGRNFADSRAALPDGYRPASAAEEWQIEGQYRQGAINNGEVMQHILDDPISDYHYFFAENGVPVVSSVKFMYTYQPILKGWQWTDTVLRCPKGWDAERFEKGPDGTNRYPRIVVVGGKEVGTYMAVGIPCAVVMEMDGVSGLPVGFSDGENDRKYGNHLGHFTFKKLPTDDTGNNIGGTIANNTDLVVARSPYYHGLVGASVTDVPGKGHCFFHTALYEPNVKISGSLSKLSETAGIRPVRDHIETDSRDIGYQGETGLQEEMQRLMENR